MARYWSQQEKSRKRGSPSYRATQRRNSRSGRKAINCEKTVRPWFMNHCPPAQNGLLEPVAVQIAARHKSPQTADSQGLVRLRKVLYRTPVIRSTLPCETTAPLAATVPFRTLVTNSTAAVPISTAVISHGPLIPYPERVATGLPLLFKIMRHPDFAVAEVPSFVGKLPTITNPERKATRAVVSPTPPGQLPGSDAASILANSVKTRLGEIWTIVVPVPCRLATLLKLLTSTLFATRAPFVLGTIATP